jgi:DNA-binding response OmpR family regulator
MTNNAEFNRPSVLVVDDEPAIAHTVAQILIQKGYSAYAASDGESAIKIALLDPPQLVISDVVMPGMNGVDLGIAIRRISPDCKVILLSGQFESRDLITAALSVGNHFVFLEKPVHPRDLLEHVAEILSKLNGPLDSESSA